MAFVEVQHLACPLLEHTPSGVQSPQSFPLVSADPGRVTDGDKVLYFNFYTLCNWKEPTFTTSLTETKPQCHFSPWPCRLALPLCFACSHLGVGCPSSSRDKGVTWFSRGTPQTKGYEIFSIFLWLWSLNENIFPLIKTSKLRQPIQKPVSCFVGVDFNHHSLVTQHQWPGGRGKNDVTHFLIN